MEPSKAIQSILSMDLSKIITKIESLSSWTSPNQTLKEDGPDAVTLESLMDMEETNAQISSNKICINMYILSHLDHIKCTLPTLTHWSHQIRVQKSITIVPSLRIVTKPSRKKWKLCYYPSDNRWNMLHSQCRR